MEYKHIVYEHKDQIARITINRPKQYNACNRETIHELIGAFARAGMDGEVGVVVLTGAGDKAFCAGGYLCHGREPNMRNKRRSETAKGGSNEL